MIPFFFFFFFFFQEENKIKLRGDLQFPDCFVLVLRLLIFYRGSNGNNLISLTRPVIRDKSMKDCNSISFVLISLVAVASTASVPALSHRSTGRMKLMCQHLISIKLEHNSYCCLSNPTQVLSHRH